jgi:hypothetical protein
MSALGYWEGRDVTLGVPWAEGVTERFPRLVAGVTALRPDVIVVAWTPGAIAAKRGRSEQYRSNHDCNSSQRVAGQRPWRFVYVITAPGQRVCDCAHRRASAAEPPAPLASSVEDAQWHFRRLLPASGNGLAIPMMRREGHLPR